MEYVEVKGQKIPALGLGTWQIEGRNCERAVENALEIGYRHIDTAQAYRNEKQVGNGIQNSEVSRDDIWLTTKIWRSNFRKEDVKKSFEQSLEKLQTEYVDLLLIHWPSKEVPFEETLNAMAELVDEGKVRNIGISNFTPDQIDEAVEVSEKPILTDQVEYHPFLDQDAVIEKCRAHEIMLTAYSPLGRGEVLGNQTLKEIGDRYSKTEAQVALRWLLQQENIAAIPKASSRQHQLENFNIFDFKLSQDEIETIESIKKQERKINPDFGPNWS